MADYINKIRTTEGDKPVNYEALANKPNSLPNPNKIKFTGSVVTEYDGSSEVTVNIPNGASEEQAAQIQTNTNDISELKNKTSELKGDFNKLSEKKIDNPSTGSVGQILEIESVDEKGKPKTYKAVDKPTSSGEVSDEQISSAVSEYMANNPIEESDPTVPEWAKSPQKPTYTASEVGADASGTAESKVSAHNVSDTAHNDIRLLVQGLTERLNALADSDDTTLDQMSEIVSYIKYNRSLINGIDTNKVGVSDIINNLTSNNTNKPLSAKQGRVLKSLIDGITTVELDESLTDNTKAAPANVVGELRSDIDYLQTTNLLYKEYIEDNWYWNGEDGSHNYNEDWRNSGLIPVSEYLEVEHGDIFQYCFITANHEFISGGGFWNNVPNKVRIEVPQNAFYVSISWSKNTGYLKAINTIAKDTIIVSKDDSGDFDNLLLATLKAYKKGSRVVVEKGNYDIKQEFKDVFGENFFFNYTQESITGIILRNNITYQFSPLANVHFEYENNGNGNVYDIFSPFNAGKWGFTLEGLNISSKNSKYCVHDERGEYTGTEGYYNRYINCNMYLDNSENSRIGTTQCIGGGLGTNGHIYIDGCIFDTEDSPTSSGNSKQAVSYHNDWREDTKSFISITNCYFKRGTIAILPYGTSPKPTEALISGNSLKSDIIHGTSDVDNIIIYAMNNEIRA